MGEKICGPLLPEDSSFIDHSSKFGSFILHAAAVDFPRYRNNALLMLSSVSSESECVSRSGSWFSVSFSKWNTGCNTLCGECDYGSGSGWRWSPNYGFCCYCGKRLAKDDGDQVVDNNNYLGGGGMSNDNDDDQQQHQLALKFENLGFPSCYNFGKIMVVGSCNGLICLHDSERSDVSLWNPATGKFRILPRSSSITIASGDVGDVHQLFAFGFDDQAKDYKVVLLSVFNRRMLDSETTDGPVAMECICHVEVYSLSTNSWKLLEEITSLPGSPFPYPPDSSSELFYLNGSCFFMAKLLYSEEEQCIPPPKNRDRFIISLDLTKQIITPIQLPNHHPCQQLYLSYLGKKIALFTKTFCYTGVYDVNDPRCSWENFCIWVFNEHRSSSMESWTRVYVFEIKLGLPGERIIPRGISNDGVFALLETGIRGGGLGNKKKKKKKMKMKMKLYNLVSKEVKNIFLSCDQLLSKAYAYQASLVSIIGEAAADDMVIGKAVAAETADDNRFAT